MQRPRALVLGGFAVFNGAVMLYAALLRRKKAPDHKRRRDARAAALTTNTRTAAKEWGKHAIRVNTILPSALTPKSIWYLEDSGTYDLELAKVALGRFGKPEDVARTALFLASDEGDYVTGQTIGAAGGNASLAWTDSPGGNYANNANTSLVSRVLAADGYSDLTLAFRLAHLASRLDPSVTIEVVLAALRSAPPTRLLDLPLINI